jgi:prepilin-type N-terminal cleavage/methylation domain-containing protein
VKTLIKTNKTGFTLIELLVVIAIIGLLASVVLLALNSARAKSRDAKRLADIRQLASAYELYFNDYGSYPTNTTAGSAILGGAGAYLVPAYIGLTPTAPTPQDGSCVATGYQGNAYYWVANATGATGLVPTYAVTFCLGAQTGGYTAGPHTLTQSGIQ